MINAQWLPQRHWASPSVALDELFYIIANHYHIEKIDFCQYLCYKNNLLFIAFLRPPFMLNKANIKLAISKLQFLEINHFYPFCIFEGVLSLMSNSEIDLHNLNSTLLDDINDIYNHSHGKQVYPIK